VPAERVRAGVDLAQVRLDLGDPQCDVVNGEEAAQQLRGDLYRRALEEIQRNAMPFTRYFFS